MNKGYNPYDSASTPAVPEVLSLEYDADTCERIENALINRRLERTKLDAPDHRAFFATDGRLHGG